MKIDRVTITGADDKVSPAALYQLSQEYPFVEWGILLSAGRSGQLRYPNFKKVIEFGEYPMKLSAHLCGKFAKDVLENGDLSVIDNLSTLYSRFQLNYNFDKSIGWNLTPVIDYAKEHPRVSIIFQYNKSNQFYLTSLLNDVDTPTNIHFLYDSSGGRGTEIQKIHLPFGNYTGYSGGIAPENISSVLKKITEVDVKQSVWIDMESGVRTDDVFDLKKVIAILKECKKVIMPEETPAEKDFTWLLNIIVSCINEFQFVCVDKLIELYKEKYKDEIIQLHTKLSQQRELQWDKIKGENIVS